MEELIEYYCNLLIMQYKNKPKAMATIEAFVKILLAEGYEVAEGYEYTNNLISLLVEQAYDLDTAVGKQLDIVAKYIGKSRTLNFISEEVFEYCEYDGTNNPPTGYDEYNIDITTYPYLEYNFLVLIGFNMQDWVFRPFLQFIAQMKNKPMSLYEVDNLLLSIFGNDIWVEEGERFDLTSNLEVIGTLTENNGVYSGFSESNYLQLTEKINLGDSFEITIPVTTPETLSGDDELIFAGLTNQYIHIYIRGATTTFGYNIGNGSAWAVTNNSQTAGSTEISPSTKYWIKFTYDGQYYRAYLSTDGSNYTLDWEFESSVVIPEFTGLIGISRALAMPFGGSIDVGKMLILANTNRNVVYHINKNVLESPIYQQAEHLDLFAKQFLPKPMGCKISIEIFEGSESSQA